jgi:hypothetical protein
MIALICFVLTLFASPFKSKSRLEAKKAAASGRGPWDQAPRYLIRDRDQVYGGAATRRLRTMGIRDKPICVYRKLRFGNIGDEDRQEYVVML